MQARRLRRHHFENPGLELERRRLMAHAPVAEVQILGSGSLPRAATAPDGVTTVVWTSKVTDGEVTDNNISDLYGRRLDPEGRPLGEPFRINDVTHGAQSYPQVGVDARGNVVVSWWDSPTGLTNHGRLEIQRYDAQGMKLGGNQLLLDDPDAAFSSNLHVLPDGGFCLVSLAPGEGYLYTRYDAGGRPQAAVLLDDLVHPGWLSSGTEANTYSDLADDALLIVWSEYRARTLPSGAWASDGRSWVRRIGLDGRQIGPDVLIASTLDSPLDSAAMWLFPSVTALDGGGFLASWNERSVDDGKVFTTRRGRIYDADGDPTSGLITLFPGTTENRSASITQLADGNIVVFTVDHLLYNTDDYRFQIFSDQGDAISDRTRLEGYAAFSTLEAHVLATRGSGFLAFGSAASPGRDEGSLFALAFGDAEDAKRSPVVLLDEGKDGLRLWGDYASISLSPWEAEGAVFAPDGRIFIDFGARGLWTWDASGLSQVNAADPEVLLVGPGGILYIDYGAFGIWSRGVDGAFKMLNAAGPESFVAAADGSLYIDYGAFGLWRCKVDGAFEMLNAADPEALATASDGSLYVDFGPYGFWRGDASGFARLNAANPEAMTPAADGSIFLDFGAFGLWRWTDRMQLVNAADPEALAAGADGSVYIDFGAFGLWNWSIDGLGRLHSGDPQSLIAGRDGYFYVDLGPAGIRRRGASGTLEWVDASGARRLFA